MLFKRLLQKVIILTCYKMKCVKEEGKTFKGLKVYSYSSGGK